MRICRGFILALVVLAAAPASALAQSGSDVKTLVIGPAQIGSYTVRVTAQSNTRVVTVDMQRRSGNSRVFHSYTLRGNVSLSGADDDSSATLVADLNKSGGGIIDFEALSPSFADPVPPECDGTEGSIRRGKVTGSLRLRLDKQGFGTLRIRQADATYGRLATYGCVNAPAAEGTYLLASKRVKSAQYFLDANQVGRRATIRYTYRRPNEFHQLLVTARRTLLFVNRADTRAQLRSTGRFLRGRATVSGGRLKGNFAGIFDFVGKRVFPRARDVSIGRA